ncbi:MAG: sucrase, partial [Bacteroidota bacterium]|nr:sucrase [Bacteroidota bacterium]MDP4227882.1 sucrase [Bacteroidota bacterium]
MKKLVLFAAVLILFAYSSCEQKKNTIPAGEFDIQSMIQPVPYTAKFINDTSYIWCGTLVKSHIDQKFHLFYSRWSRKLGM